MTGPLCPIAPMWMCAAIPAMPEVETLPLTDLSSATLMEPLPEAEVVTGGTSWLPLRVTLPPPKKPFMVWHPARASAIAINTAGAVLRKTPDTFMCSSFWTEIQRGRNPVLVRAAPVNSTLRGLFRLAQQRSDLVDDERGAVGRGQRQREHHHAAHHGFRDADLVEIALDEIARHEKRDRGNDEAEHARIVREYACWRVRKSASYCADCPGANLHDHGFSDHSRTPGGSATGGDHAPDGQRLVSGAQAGRLLRRAFPLGRRRVLRERHRRHVSMPNRTGRSPDLS